MPRFTFTEQAVRTAKEQGLHLVVLSIDGKHAKHDSASMATPVGPKTAARLWELFAELCDLEKRMQ